MRGRKAKLRGTRSGRSKAATTAPIWWETGRRDIRCLIRAPAPWPAIACPPREAPTSEGEGRKLCPRWGRKPPRFQCCSERERHPSPCSRPHQVQKCLWVGPGEWAHRSAGVPGRVTETRVSANARGDAGKPGSQAGPRGHEATTVRVMESRQARGLAHQLCRASEHGPLQEGPWMRAGPWQRSHPSPLTQSQPLQLLHYLLWGLVGTVTAEFRSAGWSGWAARLVITHGRDFFQERRKLFLCD